MVGTFDIDNNFQWNVVLFINESLQEKECICFSFLMIVNLIQQLIRLYMKLRVKIEKYIFSDLYKRQRGKLFYNQKMLNILDDLKLIEKCEHA